ncbi:MAG TPA: hypothetical protein VKX28_29155 [Xanthobacteraceae bacterium]|nr:hypothetical protein [Xanthobacteraceae bacterium]
MGSSEGAPESKSREADQACAGCGKPLELLATLPGWAEQPDYRVLGCTTCTHLEWVCEPVTSA